MDVKPSSSIKWYCDDVLVKSEYAQHSNYTFTPRALGTYFIKLSVDGFTNPMGPTKVNVIAEPTPTPTPKVTYLLPENQIYNSSSVPLVFEFNKSPSWIGYSLDNVANVTITGNTTLTGVSNGNHSLVVYANDSLGNPARSQTINFTVNVPEDYEALIAIASLVILVVVGVVLVVYFKKFRIRNKQSFLPPSTLTDCSQYSLGFSI